MDIDILLAGDLVMAEKNLVIPHPRMQQRNFILGPLKEIAPDAIHPVLKRTVLDLFRISRDPAVVRRLRARRDDRRRTAGSSKNRKLKKGRADRQLH